MNKFILATLVCLAISACGQKGPLIVDRSKSTLPKNGQEIEDAGGEGLSINEASTRLGRQTEGEPSIIYR